MWSVNIRRKKKCEAIIALYMLSYTVNFLVSIVQFTNELDFEIDREGIRERT